MAEACDTVPEEDDSAALQARREGLRAFVNDIAEHVRTLPLPESYLEAERACRSITVCDRSIQTLPQIAGDALLGDSPGDKPDAVLKPIRRHLRVRADQVMDVTRALPLPVDFLAAERAGRYALACDLMLAQLYAAPQRTPREVRPPSAPVMGKARSHNRVRPDDDADEASLDPDDYESFKHLVPGYDPATAPPSEFTGWKAALEWILMRRARAQPAPIAEPEPGFGDPALPDPPPPPEAGDDATPGAETIPEPEAPPPAETRFISVLAELDIEHRSRPFSGLSDGYYYPPQTWPPWPPPT